MSGHILERHPVPVAGVLALVSLPIHVFLPANISYAFAALLIALIAGIYVGFAVVADDLTQIAIQLVVAICFMLSAMIAWLFSPVWIAAVYVAHGLWDAVHHFEISPTRFPKWYIPLCALYDVLAGVGLAVIWSL